MEGTEETVLGGGDADGDGSFRFEGVEDFAGPARYHNACGNAGAPYVAIGWALRRLHGAKHLENKSIP